MDEETPLKGQNFPGTIRSRNQLKDPAAHEPYLEDEVNHSAPSVNTRPELERLDIVPYYAYRLYYYLATPINNNFLSRSFWARLVGTAAFVGASYYFYTTRVKRSKEVFNPYKGKFDVSTDDLEHLVKLIHTEMDSGLKKEDGSSLKMLPSFVGKPTGNEKGTYLALDLGGTNFRVLELQLKGNHGLGSSRKNSYTISETAMNGNAEQLFDFIAECVGDFLKDKPAESNAKLKLGFTFSFPVKQLDVAKGTLIEWTKGFTTQGVVGKDVVELLNQALQRKGVSVEVVALANDTVGTMVAQSYTDEKCEIGVILGTGTNACYLEKVSNIPKFTGKTNLTEMIINMEWGGLFGSALPSTLFDDQLDKESKNPGRYRFEKLISGMYLGEITRLVLNDLCQKRLIFQGEWPQKIEKPYSFPTALMSEIEKDVTPNLTLADKALFDQAKVHTTVHERRLIQEVCQGISKRAARLSAAAIYAVVTKIGKLNCTVAVDGGLFENYPSFRSTIENTFGELSSKVNIKLVLSKDGSGIGAACIAGAV